MCLSTKRPGWAGPGQAELHRAASNPFCYFFFSVWQPEALLLSQDSVWEELPLGRST